MRIKLLLIPLCLASTFPLASYALFCPTNFSIINIGDSIESVTQKCGKPEGEKKEEKDKPVPQEWTYFVSQTVATNTSYSATGTLKTAVTFDKNDKAINISVNGIGVGESTICGSAIQLGNSRDQIKSACGKPDFINKQGAEGNGEQEKDKIVEYTYKGNSPNTLIFTNGVLTGTK